MLQFTILHQHSDSKDKEMATDMWLQRTVKTSRLFSLKVSSVCWQHVTASSVMSIFFKLADEKFPSFISLRLRCLVTLFLKAVYKFFH